MHPPAGRLPGTHARAARGRDCPAHGDTDTRVGSTALSERGCEGRGRLASGGAGAIQAPLSEVLRREAWPLWRRQVRHIVGSPWQVCPELVPVDHCGHDRASSACGPRRPQSGCWPSPPSHANPALPQRCPPTAGLAVLLSYVFLFFFLSFPVLFCFFDTS